MLNTTIKSISNEKKNLGQRNLKIRIVQKKTKAYMYLLLIYRPFYLFPVVWLVIYITNESSLATTYPSTILATRMVSAFCGMKHKVDEVLVKLEHAYIYILVRLLEVYHLSRKSHFIQMHAEVRTETNLLQQHCTTHQ